MPGTSSSRAWPFAEQGDQQQVDDLFLADDDAADIGAQLACGVLHPGDFGLDLLVHSGVGYSVGAGDHDNIFALELGLVGHQGVQLRQGAALDLFEQLGQVVGQRCPAVAVHGQGVLQEGCQAKRALVEDERVRRVQVDFEKAPPLAGLARGKAAEGKAVQRQAGEHDRHDEPGRPGDHRHLFAGVDGPAHERVAGVGDAGRAGVGDERDALAFTQEAEDALPGLVFVVFVKGDLRAADLKVLEQPPGRACVLAGDEIDAAQGLQRPQRDVPQVADRGGDEIEHGRARIRRAPALRPVQLRPSRYPALPAVRRSGCRSRRPSLPCGSRDPWPPPTRLP